MRLGDALERLTGPTRDFPPRLSEREAARAARFAIPREPVRLSSGEQHWDLTLAPGPALPIREPMTVALTIGVETAHLVVPRALAEALARGVEPGADLARLDPDLMAMLLELALEGDIERLEAMLGRPVVFHSIGAGEMTPDLWARMGAPDGAGWPVGLVAPSTLVARMTEAWMVRPAAGEGVEPGAVLALRYGVARLSIADLRGLAPGDAVLPDFLIERGSAALAVLGEHLAVPVSIDNDRRARPAGPMSRTIARDHGEFLMTESNGGATETRLIDDADIDETPVELVFELGRKHLTIAEMRSLGVGAPLPLDRVVDSAVDIFAGGRRIGAGEVVQIGDRIGVRITRLGAAQ